MNEYLTIVVLALMMLVLDAPWLYLQSGWVQDFINDIQGGRSMQVRLWAGIPVYIALGYLVTQAKSAPRAFLLGLCTYAVYDFTQLFTLDKYPGWSSISAQRAKGRELLYAICEQNKFENISKRLTKSVAI